MPLHHALALVSLALAIGLLAGHLWWRGEVDRLRRDLDRARQHAPARSGALPSWSAAGIVRGTSPTEDLVVITHEPLSGLMGAMTMPFRVAERRLLDGLRAGDRVEFTVASLQDRLVVVTIRKDE